jgi:hypothetical protein
MNKDVMPNIMLSSGKVTVMIFMAVIVVYIVFYIVTTLRTENASSGKEHFVAVPNLNEMPPPKDDCEMYNLRNEVINIFDIFLKRKATTEEIEKYSALGNLNDILLGITKDFVISSSEIESKRPSLEEMRKDACKVVSTPKDDPNAGKTVLSEDVVDEEVISFTSVERTSSSKDKDKIDKVSKIDLSVEAKTEKFAESSTKQNDEPRVCIPLKSYEELKSKLLELQKQVQIIT